MSVTCFRGRVARRMVCKGERNCVPRKDELEETVVPSGAAERRNHSAVLQVALTTGAVICL